GAGQRIRVVHEHEYGATFAVWPPCSVEHEHGVTFAARPPHRIEHEHEHEHEHGAGFAVVPPSGVNRTGFIGDLVIREAPAWASRLLRANRPPRTRPVAASRWARVAGGD